MTPSRRQIDSLVTALNVGHFKIAPPSTTAFYLRCKLSANVIVVRTPMDDAEVITVRAGQDISDDDASLCFADILDDLEIAELKDDDVIIFTVQPVHRLNHAEEHRLLGRVMTQLDLQNQVDFTTVCEHLLTGIAEEKQHQCA